MLYASTAGSGPNRGALSMVVLLYRTAFTSFRLGYASAMGVVLALDRRRRLDVFNSGPSGSSGGIRGGSCRLISR